LKNSRFRSFSTLVLLLLSVSLSFAQNVGFEERIEGKKQILRLNNEQVKCSVIFEEGKLSSDRLEAQPEWLAEYGTRPLAIETDADFALNVMWTGWRAPGYLNNAENPVVLSKHDFQLLHYEVQELSGKSKQLKLFFKGLNSSLELQIIYELEKDAFYIKRKIAVCDSRSGRHFLRWIWPRRGFVFGKVTVLKSGGFGQPAALRAGIRRAYRKLLDRKRMGSGRTFSEPAGQTLVLEVSGPDSSLTSKAVSPLQHLV
jgi:hypothetical protein